MKIELPLETAGRCIIGMGAERNTTLCRVRGRTAEILGPYADLRIPEVLEAYEKELSGILSRAYEVRLACDLHPRYVTTALAERLSPSPAGPVRVQHHHAHIASVLADRGLDGEVVGLAFDGTGYGTDGTVWGMEFLVASPYGYRRAGHLAPVAMPGGDMAVREPYRMAVSHLYRSFGESLGGLRGTYDDLVGGERVAMLVEMMEKGINSPLTSSCGRLFDAVASILGICHVSGGRSEGPRGLEEIADPAESRAYPYSVENEGARRILDLSPALGGILDDLRRGTGRAIASARFHSTVADASVALAAAIAGETGIRNVVLSGGVFTNKILTDAIAGGLAERGLAAVLPRRVPVADAGLSLGQAYVAAARAE